MSRIRLLTALGVEGDAHAGKMVKHRSRVARNPDQPNLRQVHLLHMELVQGAAHGPLRCGGGADGREHNDGRT